VTGLLLVTGSGGFLGAAVVRQALEAGYSVAALSRTSSPERLEGLAGNLTRYAVDLADHERVTRTLREVAPDAVIHCAWEGVGGAARAGDVQLDNIRTTVAVVDAAIAAGADKFVGVGSQAEYGRFDRRIVESDLPCPGMLYGAAKLSAYHLARQRCSESGIDFAWLRLFSVYGPGDNPNWLIPSVAAALARGESPRCTLGTQLWDYLHIDDAAAGTVAVAQSPQATGVFNLSSGRPVAVRAIVERLRDLIAPGLPLHFGAVPFSPAQIMHLEGDSSRLSEATGWQPRVDTLVGLTDVAKEWRQ
jgi:nucleoside-diphosphate-sugar epimerase